MFKKIKQLKLPILSQFINFLNNILRNQLTYIIINASYERICVEFSKKNNNTALVFLLSNCLQVLKRLTR